MSDVANTNGGGLPGLPADYLAKLQKGIAQSRAVNQVASGGGKDLLRMGKDGIWIFGQQNEEYQTGAKIIVNPVTLGHGWVNWQEGQKKGETMCSMTADMPDQPPPINGQDYQNQVAFECKIYDGDDAGQELLYKTASYGGKAAVDELLAEIQGQLATDAAHPCPVVVLEQSHYPHPTYGKTYNPIFRIVGWSDLNGNIVAPVASVSAPVTAPPAEPAKPKKQPLSAAVSEPAKVAEPAPTAVAHVPQRKRPK